MIMTTLEYPFKILIQTILKSFLLFKSFAHFVMNPGFFIGTGNIVYFKTKYLF